jgi:hypothetical protein
MFLITNVFNMKLNKFFGLFCVFSFFIQQSIYAQNDCISNPADTCGLKSELALHGDSTLSFQSYMEFLLRINDTSKYLVLPITEFANTFRPDKVVIGLRHDVDVSLDWALIFARKEHLTGLRSTFYILHTASYYLLNPNNMTIHNPQILPLLKILQDTLNDEIGWHNDLVTLNVIYGANSHNFLNNELDWLRNNSINIQSSSAHGSNYCPLYHYMNWYFFHEFEYDTLPGYQNNMFVPINGHNVSIIKGYETEFQLYNEAYHDGYTKYFSDVKHPNKPRWTVDDFNYDTLVPGDRVEILIHPMWWHNSDNYADFFQFNIDNQIENSIINPFQHTVQIFMPSRASFFQVPKFVTEQSVEVYIDNVLQVSGISYIDCLNPVYYTLHNKISGKNQSWVVNVIYGLYSEIYNQKSILSDITLSPNPVNEWLCLQNFKYSANTYYKISDIIGRKIETNALRSSGNKARISVASLCQGTYLLQLYTEHDSRTLKFIKQ